jgi:hypothetical protein
VEISGDGSTVAFDDVSGRDGRVIAVLVVRRVAGGQLAEVEGDADGIAVGNLSDDGRLATFLGPYPPGFMSGSWSPRILDTSSGVHEVAARNLSGDPVAPDSTERVIVSGSGSHVAFSSRAGDLIADDMTGGASGFDVFRVSLTDGTDVAARTVPAGGSVATGTTATVTDPIETRVVTPVAGTIEITETDGGAAPSGYSLLGNRSRSTRRWRASRTRSSSTSSWTRRSSRRRGLTRSRCSGTAWRRRSAPVTTGPPPPTRASPSGGSFRTAT